MGTRCCFISAGATTCLHALHFGRQLDTCAEGQERQTGTRTGEGRDEGYEASRRGKRRQIREGWQRPLPHRQTKTEKLTDAIPIFDWVVTRLADLSNECSTRSMARFERWQGWLEYLFNGSAPLFVISVLPRLVPLRAKAVGTRGRCGRFGQVGIWGRKRWKKEQ